MALDPTAVTAPPDYVKIGRLGRTFQLEGALRVQLDEAVSYSGEDGQEPVGERAVQAAGQLFVTGLGEARVRQLYYSGGSLLVKLEGVRDRTAAQALVNANLWLDPSRLSPDLAQELLDEVAAGSNEERLIGEPVLLDGRQIGTVSAAMLDSPNPVLEVTLEDGGTKSLIPLQAPYVQLTDEGVELTDPPAGLLGPS